MSAVPSTTVIHGSAGFQPLETEKEKPLSPNEQKLQKIFKKTLIELSDGHQSTVRFLERSRIFAFVAAPISFLGTIAVASPLAKVALVISGIFFAVAIWSCPRMIKAEKNALFYETRLHTINIIENLFTDIKVMVSKNPKGPDDSKEPLTLDDFPDDGMELHNDIAHEIIKKTATIYWASYIFAVENNRELCQMLSKLNVILEERTYDISVAKGSFHLVKDLLKSVEDKIMEMKRGYIAAYFDLSDKKSRLN